MISAEAPAANITSIDQLCDAMESLGYASLSRDDENTSFSTAIEIGDTRYPVILDISDDGSQLMIEAQIGTLGEIPDDTENALAFMTRMVSINSEIAPFATNIQEPDDELLATEIDISPITLISNVPLGDFAPEELDWQMMKLQSALYLTIETKNAIIQG